MNQISQMEKSDCAVYCEQANKRRACALTGNAPELFYIKDKVSKTTLPPISEAIAFYAKRLQPVFASKQTTIEVNAYAEAQSETNDCVMIFSTLEGIPIFFQKVQTALPVPATLCIEPSSQRDYDHQHDFLEHFRQRERSFRPKPHYLNHQIEIDHASRAILVNWLVSVVNEGKFDAETLYLTVSYVDRFLSQIVLSRNRLQLIGITAVYVAAKYEETRPPGVSKFAFIGGVSFDTKQIVKMERLLLSTLSFDLHAPTIHSFAVAYATLTDTPHSLKFLTLYICELSLLEAEPYLQFLPSQISAASHALARYLLGYSIWSRQLEKLTLYRPEDLKQTILYLCKTHFRAAQLFSGAIQMKFMEERYHQVALIGPVSMNDFVFDQVVHKYNSFS